MEALKLLEKSGYETNVFFALLAAVGGAVVKYLPGIAEIIKVMNSG